MEQNQKDEHRAKAMAKMQEQSRQTEKDVLTLLMQATAIAGTKAGTLAISNFRLASNYQQVLLTAAVSTLMSAPESIADQQSAALLESNQKFLEIHSVLMMVTFREMFGDTAGKALHELTSGLIKKDSLAFSRLLADMIEGMPKSAA